MRMLATRTPCGASHKADTQGQSAKGLTQLEYGRTDGVRVKRKGLLSSNGVI